jgi:hypothetical protein
MAYCLGIRFPLVPKKQETTMPQPPQAVDPLFEDVLQDLPPETVPMARECKAFTRARTVTTPVQLLRLVLRYCGLDHSLREVAGHFTLLQERRTESAGAERLVACRPWGRALLPCLLGQPSLDAWPPQRRFLVLDGRGVPAPGARGTPYRLHLWMEMVTWTLTDVAMTDMHTGASLRHFPLAPGDVAVADRGYGPPATIVQTGPQGAEVVRRLNPPNVPVTHREGTPLAWSTGLGQLPAVPVSTLPVPLVVTGAAPLPELQANKARRVCRQQSRKNGQQPSPQTLLLAGGVLVVTTLPPALLPGPTALALSRVRWQIESAIKRWTSVLDVDVPRARYASPLADVWLHGKWRYGLMLDKRLRRTLGEQWSWLDRPRTATWWRPWKLLRAEVAPRITGVLGWQHLQWPACLQVLAERPRRRQLQRLPHEVTLMFSMPDPHRQPSRQQAMAA